MSNIFDLFKKIESSGPSANAPIEFLIAGLGNPGKEYERTRHNVGFVAIDAIASDLSVRIDRAKYKALITEVTLGGKRGLLMKPQTFMNSSGEAVSAAAKFYKIAPENIIVISDDVSLDVGRIRVRRKGSHGGQKGLKSIQEQLGTENYQRIKIGVGAKPHPDYDMAAWVLSNFDAHDMAALAENYPRIYDGLCFMLEGKTEDAMQICNNKI